MGERKYTAEQTSAIETRDKTLLVSAAAGSGKTATLTERIIQSLLDEKNPADISKMLIVTFTNAAVGELRERITAAIKGALLKHPENKRLEKQLFLLSGAKISTIDAFCNDIFRNNAERFGISPKYRIADPIEAEILARSVLSSLIDAIYENELTEVSSPEDFALLCESLAGVKSEGMLEDIFMRLYRESENLEEGVNVFKRFSDELNRFSVLPVEENRYAVYISGLVKETAGHYINIFEKFSEFLSCEGGASEKYAELAESDTAILLRLKSENDYEKTALILTEKFQTAPRVKAEDKTDTALAYLSARDELKEELKTLYSRYYFASRDEWSEILSSLSEALALTHRFLDKFNSVYFAEKRSRAMLEYADIERLAYMSLYEENGELSEYALALKQQFDAVYIDEYQDVNALQNRIFEAVSRADNRFMVGDIKQSIYGFRSAKPEIFAEMKSRFPMLKDAKDSCEASIFMSENFRCDRGIVDFVNGIFDVMFGASGRSIGYVPEDRLKFGKGAVAPEPEYFTPEIKVFTKEFADTLSEDEELSSLPPDFTACKIKELISNERLSNGEKIRPSDIAIVLRRDGGRAKAYRDALAREGISAEIPADGEFFFNPDIQLALCLLNSIDNPERDIYLAGLMCSPIYAFTPDELLLIKRTADSGSLWQSLRAYTAENPEFEKGVRFIRSILTYRALSEGVTVDALIMRLYGETGILALASRTGGKENLMLLYSYARDFEGSSYKGLHSFINYVNTIIESGEKFSPKKSEADTDSVTIITVHKSKGLEFPVVFLADAGGSLVSAMSSRERVVYSDSFGIAMKLRRRGGISLLESPVYYAVRDYIANEAREEELRVYYVALTRARERLYVVGQSRDADKDSLRLRIMTEKMSVDSYTLRKMKSVIDIILVALENPKLSVENAEDTELENTENVNTVLQNPSIAVGIDADMLRERFTYIYPRAELTKMPEKLSISKLYPTVLDTDDEEIRLSIDGPEKDEAAQGRGHLPEFISGSPEDESAKKGIVTHTFLQFCDLRRFEQTSASDELDRLIKDGFISEENRKRVRLYEIEMFRRSSLFKEMLASKNLYREFRFNVKLPAGLFTQDEEKRTAYKDREILLQGVIDCLIEDADGNLHIVDYKTDRLPKEAVENREIGEGMLREKHSLQLFYYSLAVEKIFGRLPTDRRIYSLLLGDTVSLD